VDLTIEQGIATCPMSPSGLLKATGPMSPSYVQRVKCSGREHKPQFAPLLCASLISGELKLGSSVEAWEEVVDHLARWRHIDASPSGTPEGDSIYVATLVETWAPSPSACFSRLRRLGCRHPDGDTGPVAFLVREGTLPPAQCLASARVLLQAAGFARVVDFGSSRGKRWDSDVVVCRALLAETGTPVVGVRRGTVVRPDYGSCGYLWFRVSLRREVSDMDRWSRLGSCGALVYTGFLVPLGETSQQFPPQRSEETVPQ
ncbi:hypothetical protein Taro_022499, partial [Colocasia esculenta]|nr:hypothetical protein [Colocasia esculenta]